MKCPTDSATLVMSERAGIEIDYCPECRGVWLDRGELDKILERAAADVPAAPAAPSPVPQQQYAEPRYDAPRRDESPRYDDRRGGYGQQPYRKKKKEHWLSEIFD
ncbi:zf-TFIIB domain-containing protein [Aeromicrobium fastidiosum]|uniref:TFIIB-type zinc ribbon-containing protein n=1 Tax=Aeromicrobium TaxID=2040 RepID=UPI00177E1825|nr:MULTISPECIES: zf-TFIIB domain-containing protein [Aeromicrobium]MBD8607724.1 zf-TFIIB domain-containing protein [Aeromicrobium sp. CFBP 8757]MCL8251508.1 zf-TFIIB domain-containing protein [Aeromicrobium fastidiosum]